MSRVRIVRTPAAEADLIDIWCTIAAESLRGGQAAGRCRRTHTPARGLPDSGVARPDIDAQARALVEGNYLIPYRHAGDHVEVVRIVHGARDLTTLL